VPYLSALEVCSQRGATQIHVYLTLPIMSEAYISMLWRRGSYVVHPRKDWSL